jgi:hypothetical protein
LGERLHGMQEVASSILAGSTKLIVSGLHLPPGVSCRDSEGSRTVGHDVTKVMVMVMGP